MMRPMLNISLLVNNLRFYILLFLQRISHNSVLQMAQSLECVRWLVFHDPHAISCHLLQIRPLLPLLLLNLVNRKRGFGRAPTLSNNEIVEKRSDLSLIVFSLILRFHRYVSVVFKFILSCLSCLKRISAWRVSEALPSGCCHSFDGSVRRRTSNVYDSTDGNHDN